MQTTGRAQPSREDKNEFLHALGQSAAGQPTVPMLYFYKYLLKHGEEDGMPQLDKDLFFYIEVQKFKVGTPTPTPTPPPTQPPRVLVIW